MQLFSSLALPMGVQWRSLGSVGASIGDPFEGAGVFLFVFSAAFHRAIPTDCHDQMWNSEVFQAAQRENVGRPKSGAAAEPKSPHLGPQPVTMTKLVFRSGCFSRASWVGASWIFKSSPPG